MGFSGDDDGSVASIFITMLNFPMSSARSESVG